MIGLRRTLNKGCSPLAMVTPEVRASWDRFTAAKRVADATLRHEDGRASAYAFWEFVSLVGSAQGLVALIGPLVAPDDPLAGLLWFGAAHVRERGPKFLYGLALHRERRRLTSERDALLGAAQAGGSR